MKNKAIKLCSVVLTATTLISVVDYSVTGFQVSAITENNSVNVVNNLNKLQAKNSQYQNTGNYRATGDLTLQNGGLSEDRTVIDSVKKYYSIKEKKYKVSSGISTSTSLPSSVDNSQSKYFPKVGDQKELGSCVAWSQIYYQFTYTMNKQLGVTTTSENSFSPKWGYDLSNGGGNSGLLSEDLYDVMKHQGVAQMWVAPYDDDYFSWIPTEEAWSNALKYKLKDYQYFDDVGGEDKQITSANDSDLDLIKTALSSGEILTYSTHIYSWKSTTLKTNPMVPENSKFAGEEVVTAEIDVQGGHRMALVGYNDNIWTDINNNDKVDSGEMGAFKIVNSWSESFANNGFMWIAYDALNKNSAVEGAPYYPNKREIFESIARIDVEPVRDNSDMYLRCTLNTSNRAEVDVYLIAEKNGTVYEETGFATSKYNLYVGEYAFNGTTNPSDGTLAFALNSVIPNISGENFNEYNWSVKFVDKENNKTVLTVKDVSIVDVGENKIYKPNKFTAFTLNGEEKTVDITATTLNDVVIYYVGYYTPTLHYKVETGVWKTIQMEATSERYGYTHKYVIPSDKIINVALYFTDDNGAVDNNNGKYYNAGRRLNYYVTENQAKPLSVSLKLNSIPDVNKLIHYIASAKGGYEPYRYEFVFTKLDDGTEKIRDYQHIDEASWFIRYKGNYRITVNAKDQSNKVVSTSIDFYADDMPFQFTSLTSTPDKHIMTGDIVKFTAISDFENVISRGTEYSIYNIVIKNNDTNKIVYKTSKRSDLCSLIYKTSTNNLSWIPAKEGNYIFTISSTDGSKDYAEKSISFKVSEYNGTIIGDATNDKKISVADAMLILKYNIRLVGENDIWLNLSDCDNNGKVDLKDAICVLRRVIGSGNCKSAGQVNYREPITEPPTEAPTQAPTQPPTVVESNVVTFTNSLNWSGTIYCYYWSDTNKSMTTWPGKPMTKSGANTSGQAIYTFDVPKDATYVIFTNGSIQTVDIPYSGGNIKYSPTTTDSKGHYNVKQG